MSEETTIFLTTAIAIVLSVYTLVILANASRYLLGKVRYGLLLQLFGLFMVAIAFLWGSIGLLLNITRGLWGQQVFLFLGILFMFFAARRLFGMEKAYAHDGGSFKE